jgi:hypothetical protein
MRRVMIIRMKKKMVVIIPKIGRFLINNGRNRRSKRKNPMVMPMAI